MRTGVLLSGGIDSTSLAFWKHPDVAITVDYGQLPAQGEIRAATKIARILKIKHEIIQVDCHTLGSGDMAGRSPNRVAPVPEWWPYRNQLLITLAGMRAIALNINLLMIGSVKRDGVHVDGRRQFFRRVNQLMKMQEGKIKIESPAIALDSVELVQKSKITFDVLAWTHSCHVSDYACGNCRGCFKHQFVMKKLGYEIY
ncbi:MAG TPA: 7-cyano-7-deazaguanine synthase [Candidatus Acidoferrales bacterium]|nr:7-cyano-7-deazaguanine synthase [Candidatus Acidoferrales bacterium]